MPQIEISNSLSVLDDSGRPQNFGWSRQPCFFYDPVLVYAPRHRISESDRYIVHSPTHLVVFEIRDDGWLGYMGISVISLRDKKRSTQIYKTFLPLGVYELPTSSVRGNVRWRRKKTHLDFISMEGGAKIIKTDIPKFGHHRSLRGELVLSEPEPLPAPAENSPAAGSTLGGSPLGDNSPAEPSHSLVTNQCWRNEKNSFRYSRCSPWYIAEGVIQFGSTEIIFTKGNGWGIFDWNRGARPKADIRYWAAGCGISDGRQLSFCAGYSRAEFSYGTENGFFVEGVLHKLDQITFHIPLSNWLSPWRFTSNDNRIEMTFYPHQERIDRRGLFFFSSTRRQVFGFFSGKVQLDDGSILEFQNLTGFAERGKMQY